VATAERDGGSAGGPTVLRILLGAQLRRLREARGISRAKAGWEIRASESKISRIELGRVGFKDRDVADLLTLYGVADLAERAALLALARQANAPDWWQRYGDVLPVWFQSYLGLEAAAMLIRTYEVQFVPGLLQIPQYAEAVIRLDHYDAADEEVERRVGLRMQRRQALGQPRGPRFWAVVDEAALRRPVGGRAVMCAQLESLIEATGWPNIRLQVIPLRVGGHSAAGGSYTILRFTDPDLPDIVYVEQLIGALYLDKREDVESYAAAMERLVMEAEPPGRTAEVLRTILAETSAKRAPL
jgi:hypothetical protein